MGKGLTAVKEEDDLWALVSEELTKVPEGGREERRGVRDGKREVESKGEERGRTEGGREKVDCWSKEVEIEEDTK